MKISKKITTIIFTVGIAVFFIFYFVDLFYFQKKRLHEVVRYKIESFEKLLPPIREGIWSYDENLIHVSIDSLDRVGGMFCTLIRDNNNDILKTLAPRECHVQGLKTFFTKTEDLFEYEVFLKKDKIYIRIVFFRSAASNESIGKGWVGFSIKEVINQNEKENNFFILFFSFLIFILCFTIFFLIKKMIVSKIIRIIEASKMMSKGYEADLQLQGNDELVQLYDSVFEMWQKTILLERKSTLSKISKQVAHDIRSPLTALEMATSFIKNIEEEDRLIIRSAVNRIGDIANNLARQENTINAYEYCFEIISIPSLLKNIVSEKRVQYKDLKSINIHFELTEKDYGKFAHLHSGEFARVISNLINNAIEALPHEGYVDIQIKESKLGLIAIEIKDNGKGIPAEIVSSITQEGFSFDKKTGSGLGLYHAKNTLEKFGGELVIHSQVQEGTCITLKIPTVKPPLSFVEAIHLNQQVSLVIMDDDDGIHKIWEKRLKNLNLPHSLIHFLSVKKFEDWLQNRKNLASYIFLVDYEFLNESLTGIDLISKHNLTSHSYLITSHYNQPHIQTKCLQMGLPLVDKSMAMLVPIYKEKF